MPAKKIIEAVMSTLAVMGSSMATATAGPMPGSTPTAVPSAQPTRAHSRFAGVIAVAKPASNASKISIALNPRFERGLRRRHRSSQSQHACALSRALAYSHPVAVRPGRLIARNCVNSQNTGAAMASPVATSTASTPGDSRPVCPPARRSPCTASA